MSDNRPLSERPAARPAAPDPALNQTNTSGSGGGSSALGAKGWLLATVVGVVGGGIVLANLAGGREPEPTVAPPIVKLSIEPASDPSPGCLSSMSSRLPELREAYDQEGEALDRIYADGSVSPEENDEQLAVLAVTEALISDMTLGSLNACVDAPDWLGAARTYPEFVGLTDGSFVDDISLSSACSFFRDTPVCVDAAERGLDF